MKLWCRIGATLYINEVEFEDISVNPETECLEEPFFIFKTGDHREKVWKWFDKHYSKGVYTLLYGEIE